MFSFTRSRSRLRIESSRSRSRPKTGRLRNPDSHGKHSVGIVLVTGPSFKSDQEFKYLAGNHGFVWKIIANEEFFIQDPLSHRVIEKRRRDRMNSCLGMLSLVKFVKSQQKSPNLLHLKYRYMFFDLVD